MMFFEIYVSGNRRMALKFFQHRASIFDKKEDSVTSKFFEVPVIPGEETIASFVRLFSADDLVERMTSRERGRILGRDPVSAIVIIMEFFSRFVTESVPKARSAIHYSMYSRHGLADLRQAILRRRAERKAAYLASLEDEDWGGMTGEEISTTDKDPNWILWCHGMEKDIREGQEKLWAEKSA